jgi:hypothetical protein
MWVVIVDRLVDFDRRVSWTKLSWIDSQTEYEERSYLVFFSFFSTSSMWHVISISCHSVAEPHQDMSSRGEEGTRNQRKAMRNEEVLMRREEVTNEQTLEKTEKDEEDHEGNHCSILILCILPSSWGHHLIVGRAYHVSPLLL